MEDVHAEGQQDEDPGGALDEGALVIGARCRWLRHASQSRGRYRDIGCYSVWWVSGHGGQWPDTGPGCLHQVRCEEGAFNCSQDVIKIPSTLLIASNGSATMTGSPITWACQGEAAP
ncbi:hypothetical protein GCM10010359_27290 [Streptomyces morookaense]|nr:hypothetical protein GCM10010359_27290 [Streptomyces morookaense]